MSKTSTTPVNTSNDEQVESSLSPEREAKTLHISKPLGHVNIPALICGGVAALISIALDLMNRYDSLTLSIQETYQPKPFYLENIDTWHNSWDWVFAIILASVIAYVVLDSAGKGKRVLFGIVSIILTVMFSPLLMLWGMFWLPITAIVAVIFAWIFAFVYTTQHIMPCELGMKMKKSKKSKQRQHKNKSTPIKKSKLVKKLEKSPVEEENDSSFQPIEKNLKTDA